LKIFGGIFVPDEVRGEGFSNRLIIADQIPIRFSCFNRLEIRWFYMGATFMPYGAS
jgi:hypothetical protein